MSTNFCSVGPSGNVDGGRKKVWNFILRSNWEGFSTQNKKYGWNQNKNQMGGNSKLCFWTPSLTDLSKLIEIKSKVKLWWDWPRDSIVWPGRSGLPAQCGGREVAGEAPRHLVLLQEGQILSRWGKVQGKELKGKFRSLFPAPSTE